MKEANLLTTLPNFKGYIHDVGGPTANFRRPSCDIQEKNGLCKGRKCLAPTPCKNIISNHDEYMSILRELREIPKVKKVFIRSGIRYDFLLCGNNDEFFKELVEYHVSGQLKVAPEHCSAAVLDKMGKPHIEAYKEFSKKYFNYTKSIGKEQYLVPYLMSSHPGATLKNAVELARFIKEERLHPEQVQDFYPTPGTISTAMYYTEMDPYTLEPVYVAKNPHDKAMQRAIMQYFNPKNYDLVIEALKRTGRTDLIGREEKCLIAPRGNDAVKFKNESKNAKNSHGRKANKGANKNVRQKGLQKRKK